MGVTWFFFFFFWGGGFKEAYLNGWLQKYKWRLSIVCIDQRYGTSSLSLVKKRVCLGKRQSLCRSDANSNANVRTKQEQTQVIWHAKSTSTHMQCPRQTWRAGWRIGLHLCSHCFTVVFTWNRLPCWLNHSLQKEFLGIAARWLSRYETAYYFMVSDSNSLPKICFYLLLFACT